MRTPLFSSLLFIAIACGCTASGSGTVRYSAEVTPPRLLYVSSDVQVIEDYDQPVFFSSNFYWRYDNGVWYRSPNHRHGWIRVSVVPIQIRRIERPTAYIHFRGNASAVVQHPAPAPVVRDHREDDRETREDKREIKQERKDDRKDDRRDAKEDRKDAKKNAKEDRRDDPKHDKK